MIVRRILYSKKKMFERRDNRKEVYKEIEPIHDLMHSKPELYH